MTDAERIASLERRVAAIERVVMQMLDERDGVLTRMSQQLAALERLYCTDRGKVVPPIMRQ